MTHALIAVQLAAAGTPAPSGPPSSGNPGVDLSSFLVLSDGQKVSDAFSKPADMVNLLVSNAFVFAGLFIFVLILLAGFKFLSGESKGMQEAQTLLINAGMGFGLLFCAYWIVQIVQFITGIKVL